MSETQQVPAIAMRDASISAMGDGSFIVLEKVDWTVSRGEFWVVGGPQHSGKSDLLLATAGLMPVADGRLEIFGKDPETFGEAEIADRLRVGLVPETGRLFAHLTVAENVALPLRYHKNLSAADAAPTVKMLLDLMELTPLSDLTPGSLAANWRRRVALARALILKPELLLLDNPLGGLTARHLFWWVRFLGQLGRGHEICGGQAMTIAATTDDFRPWRTAPRQFALLRDRQFIPVGSWKEIEVSDDPVVKEMLAVELETMAAPREGAAN